MVDEAKFLSRRAITQNLLPITTTRSGVFLMLSSANDKWCEFQDYCFKNRELDIIDTEEKGSRLRRKGSDETKNLYFYGRRHYQNHWEYMVKSDPKYMMAISTHLNAVGNNREDTSFATQRDNLFLSKKTSSFFDINELEGIGIFQYYNPHTFINNPRYVIVGGLDIAVSGDISDFTIKAIENGYGMDRKSYILFRMVMNPTKSKQADSVYNQMKSVFQWIRVYGVSAIAIDETGIGKSASDYLIENMRAVRYTKLHEKNIFPIVFNNKNRFEILEHYYNRIQSGLEIMPKIPEEYKVDEQLRNMYIKNKDKFDDESNWIRFVHEHAKFGRNEIKDNNDMVKVEYRQANEKYLHDDAIFSSSIASSCLLYNPNVHATGHKAITSQRGVSRFKRSWKKR